MTAKEKAENIFYRFHECGFSFNQRFDSKLSKQCSLITVDEILKAVTTIADKKYDFYTEVKREIELL